MSCEECGEHVRMGEDELRCRKPRCWAKRRRAWEAQRLARESKEQGIAALEEGKAGVRFDWQTEKLVEERCKDREGQPQVPPLGLKLCPYLRLVYHRAGNEVIPICGSEDGFKECRAWLNEGKRTQEEEKEERAAACREVLQRGAEVLARELEAVPDLVVELLCRGMRNGWGWKELPAEKEKAGEYRIALAWSALAGAMEEVSSFNLPERDEVVDKVRAVLGEAGLEY